MPADRVAGRRLRDDPVRVVSLLWPILGTCPRPRSAGKPSEVQPKAWIGIALIWV
jgi:hypothetical protein